MANEAKTGGKVDGNNAVSERTAKAAITRSITAAKVGKLSPQNQFAYREIAKCRTNLDKLQGRLLDGGTATGELCAAISRLSEQIGLAMFA